LQPPLASALLHSVIATVEVSRCFPHPNICRPGSSRHLLSQQSSPRFTLPRFICRVPSSKTTPGYLTQKVSEFQVRVIPDDYPPHAPNSHTRIVLPNIPPHQHAGAFVNPPSRDKRVPRPRQRSARCFSGSDCIRTRLGQLFVTGVTLPFPHFAGRATRSRRSVWLNGQRADSQLNQ